ncbi:alpha/beta-type small acid-soluble spore protein [Alkalicella caledoniensis]|nr:alpha/beta-type small acid-soluble spore protein [Alkalicella caledoniensis]
MASRRRRQYALPEAAQVMERFKYETAEELGLADKVRQVGWENMTTRECGMVGGMMVKKMIEATGKYTLDD